MQTNNNSYHDGASAFFRCFSEKDAHLNAVEQLTFPSTDLFGSQVLTKQKEEETKDIFLEEIDDKIYEIPDLPKLELGDGLANTLGAEADNILKETFVNSKKLEDEVLENIKEEYGFEEIKNAFHEASVP